MEELCQKGAHGIVQYGSEAWERDYRIKKLVYGEPHPGKKEGRIEKDFVNNIHVSSRGLLEGERFSIRL